MNNSTRFFTLLLATVLLLSGCTSPHQSSQPAIESTQAAQPEASFRHLDLSLQQEEKGSQLFHPDELGGNFLHNMQYRRVKDVTITIDGEMLPLETALAQGKANEEDILYLARQDARAGLCETEAVSLRGVTNFYFHYPEYSLKIIHDIQETPDGGQYLISELLIYAPGMEMGPTTHFFDPETDEYLDLEDWGLEFEVQRVSPTGITLACTQSGGQQIGNLVINYYYLAEKSGTFWEKAEEMEGAPFDEVSVNMDGATTVTIDWTQWYGELPGGEYVLLLDIDDRFEPEQVPPLTVDFHKRQLYPVSFTVPEQ